MTNIAIQVEDLSKLYHIGKAQKRHDTLRDALVSMFRRSNVRTSEGSTDHWALKDVSFEVKRGEVVGIIGRNGAGKSTLLKILSRITEPTSGRVELHGRVASLLEVGTGFHPELTGRENIYLNGAILGMKRAEIDRKFDEIVAFAEIEKFLDTPVKRYSSGMFVRLAFAVAAHLEPEILLVDEVLAVGDIQFQRKCIDKIGDVTTGGVTVLLVSHNLPLMATLCKNAIWLDYGELRALGNAQQIADRYQSTGGISDDGGVASSSREMGLSQSALIRSLQVFDDEQNNRLVFEQNEFLNLLVSTSDSIPEAAYFEWVLTTERGIAATSAGSFMNPIPLRLPTPSLSVHSRIGPLNLAQGHYFLTLRIGVAPGYIVDEWQNAARIVISRYVPEHIGFPFDTRRGVTYVPTTFGDGGESNQKNQALEGSADGS